MIDNTIIAETKPSRLSNAISDFKNNNLIEPYLFANYATVMMISSLANGEVEHIRDYKTNCIYYKYGDCKLFVDNDIPFGIIKVR